MSFQKGLSGANVEGQKEGRKEVREGGREEGREEGLKEKKKKRRKEGRKKEERKEERETNGREIKTTVFTDDPLHFLPAHLQCSLCRGRSLRVARRQRERDVEQGRTLHGFQEIRRAPVAG